MTWTTFHRRGDVLDRVIIAADSRLDGVLPMDVEGVAETFRGELDLLGALQLRLYTRLSGRIERELVLQPMDLEGAVVHAWKEVAKELPGIRAILDHYCSLKGDPLAEAMATAVEAEHHMLALTAGRVSRTDDLAARIGARIADRARQELATEPAAAPVAEEDHTILGRLRKVLHAA
ncbi:hypothetical protein [Nocardioides limicola]|uniref:hypothetical protein n=1 Tax=Nocardioides limicola TaxID=2803368 RepID=UPI00193AE244|nr:hypothetical protein [Nocardioides sp. DJM-14]